MRKKTNLKKILPFKKQFFLDENLGVNESKFELHTSKQF